MKWCTIVLANLLTEPPFQLRLHAIPLQASQPPSCNTGILPCTTVHPSPIPTPPHPHLSQEAAHMLRLLQTHTFPHRTQLIHTHPHLFTTPTCPACGALDTHYHSLCECPADPYPPLPSPHLWEQMLRDPEESGQVLTTSRALAVAAVLWTSTTPNT